MNGISSGGCHQEFDRHRAVVTLVSDWAQHVVGVCCRSRSASSVPVKVPLTQLCPQSLPHLPATAAVSTAWAPFVLPTVDLFGSSVHWNTLHSSAAENVEVRCQQLPLFSRAQGRRFPVLVSREVAASSCCDFLPLRTVHLGVKGVEVVG